MGAGQRRHDHDTMAQAPKRFRSGHELGQRGYDRQRSEAYAWRSWYSTSRWRKRRAVQLKAEPLCRMCLAEGFACEATVADHVTPHRGDADLFWGGELQSLCASHHSSAKQADERRPRR